MWIERYQKQPFTQELLSLHEQVLILRGARQVGKTSFVLRALDELHEYPQLKINLIHPSTYTLDGIQYLGRDFVGASAESFLKNIELTLGPPASLAKPVLIFVDEVDQYPLLMEAVQTLAEFSGKLKFIFTGSNLENIQAANVATGRKRYVDLYPINFREFLYAGGDEALRKIWEGFSLKNIDQLTDFYHQRLKEQCEVYLRLGGLPKVLATYLDEKGEKARIPQMMTDLALSIEENVKSVMGEQAKLYEYEDVLRRMVLLSLNTLKFSRLQVSHAGRSEAKRLVGKTVGARVAHKIRLWDSDTDLSKYILFDCGIAHYLLHGSDVLRSVMTEKNRAILYETFAGNELVHRLGNRDDLYYWKSGNTAEVEFLLRAPLFAGIDVKSASGRHKSLDSFALQEDAAGVIIKITGDKPKLIRDYWARLPHSEQKRAIPLLILPHYFAYKVQDLMEEAVHSLKHS